MQGVGAGLQDVRPHLVGQCPGWTDPSQDLQPARLSSAFREPIENRTRGCQNPLAPEAQHGAQAQPVPSNEPSVLAELAATRVR